MAALHSFNSLALNCSLKIVFLRPEPAGKIYQDGDLDNRIKTLLDALAIPKEDHVKGVTDIPTPMYCLMEDDALMTGFAVETARLLGGKSKIANEVRLYIEVDVRVSDSHTYNQTFLGD